MTNRWGGGLLVLPDALLVVPSMADTAQALDVRLVQLILTVTAMVLLRKGVDTSWR